MEKKMETTIGLRLYGQGDLVIWFAIWLIGIINLLTKSSSPSQKGHASDKNFESTSSKC